MSKQFTVHLSPRQCFDVYTFVVAIVQPKNRDETRKLAGVFETFGLDAIQERIDSLDSHGGEPCPTCKRPNGESISSDDFSKEPQAIETGSVDLNTLLGYLDLPGARAQLALRLLVVSDELQRAKEGRALTSVPEENTGT